MSYTITPETILWQKRAGIITESQHNLMLEVLSFLTLIENEAPSSEFDNLVKKVSAETNLKDKNTQLDFLNTLIDSGFQPEKVNPEEITEYKETLEESGGIEGIIHFLEKAETIEMITHSLGIKEGKLKEVINFFKKVAAFPFKLIEKFFFAVARFLGADVETAAKSGVGGLALVGVVCIIFAAIHFPSTLASISGAFGIVALGKLGWALVSNYAGIKSLWDKFKAHKVETSKLFTTNDFLTSIEKQYKEKTGEKFSTGEVFSMKDWFNQLPTKGKQGNMQTVASKSMKDVADAITQNKKNSGDLEKLIKLAGSVKGGEKIIALLQKLKKTFPENLL